MQPPLRLELRHYETVVAIVELGTMTAAAQQLATSQSALSHRLAEAERRLGVRLFARGHDRRLTPTSHGRALHQAAARAIAELRRVEDALIGASGLTETTLRVGVGSYEAYHWFPGFLAHLRERWPQIDLDLVVVGDAPGPALATRTVDLVLAPGRPVGDHDLVFAFDDELVLLHPPGHRFEELRHVDAADLASETFFTYNLQPVPGFEYDQFVSPGGAAAQLVRVVKQTSAIVELVSAGAGVSILSRWATWPAANAGRVGTTRCGPSGLPIGWTIGTRPNDQTAADVADLLSEYLRASSLPDLPAPPPTASSPTGATR